jgi:hypothetical protein
MARIDDFREVWGVDFEFTQPDGERPQPLCMVAMELRTGQTIRLWQDELYRYDRAPFLTDEGGLVVAYYASAEMNCFLALDWSLPVNLIDLYAEYSLITSGLPTPCGRGLLGALTAHAIKGGVSELFKDEMRDLAQRGGAYTWQEQTDLLNYCETDVVPLAGLLRAMQPAIEAPPTMPPVDHQKALGQALLRGDYVKAVAEMESRGVPIDVELRDRLLDSWPQVELDLIRTVDRPFRVYDGATFVASEFDRYLAENHIAWPRSASGALKLDKDTFKEASQTYTQLAPLHELRATLAQMREWKLPVGRDGRNRTLLSPFGAKTGRNTPSGSGFIFCLASHLRGLVKPPPGGAIAYQDYEQQEFGIAAFLSDDAKMKYAYYSGDPYLTFAKQAGAVPPHATKESHGATRDLFKTCALGVQYGMGAESLANRIGGSLSEARELLRLHRETYPHYWSWSEACVSFAMAYGHLTATYGWRTHVGPDTRPTSLRNFLLQSNGGEMLRWACVLCSQRGLPICCPIHDALLIEDTAGRIDETVEAVREAMVEASEMVLPGFPLRVEVKVYRHPERFMDKRGARMWDTIWGLINGRG